MPDTATYPACILCANNDQFVDCWAWGRINIPGCREKKTEKIKQHTASHLWSVGLKQPFTCDGYLRKFGSWLADGRWFLSPYGFFPPPMIAVHLAYAFGWSGCRTLISLAHVVNCFVGLGDSSEYSQAGTFCLELESGPRFPTDIYLRVVRM